MSLRGSDAVDCVDTNTNFEFPTVRFRQFSDRGFDSGHTTKIQRWESMNNKIRNVTR